MPSQRYRAIAEYYDPEYEHLGMLQHDVPFFLAQLPRRRQAILELAVGTARAAIPLAQAGHRVVGVDCDPAMLAIGKSKRDVVGLSESQLSLQRGDILRLDLKRRFDWICLLFNTFANFTTLAQQDAVLSAVRRHLKRTGRFWLDIFQPDPRLLARPFTGDLEPTVFYVPQLERTVARLTDIRVDPARQLQHVTFHYTWFDRSGVEQRQRVEFDLTFFFPRELRLLLERNGLRLRKMFGDHDGRPLTASSPRMIALCEAM